MRRPMTFGIVFGIVTFMSFGPGAQAFGSDPRWDAMAPADQALIDRLAAQFYESELRQAQSDAIEQRTSEIYAESAGDEREQFREDRRAAWQAMSEIERASLRGVKRPAYRNLTEEQKAPFRQHAIDQLGGAGAVDRDALADAIRNDI